MAAIVNNKNVTDVMLGNGSSGVKVKRIMQAGKILWRKIVGRMVVSTDVNIQKSDIAKSYWLGDDDPNTWSEYGSLTSLGKSLSNFICTSTGNVYALSSDEIYLHSISEYGACEWICVSHANFNGTIKSIAEIYNDTTCYIGLNNYSLGEGYLTLYAITNWAIVAASRIPNGRRVEKIKRFTKSGSNYVIVISEKDTNNKRYISLYSSSDAAWAGSGYEIEIDCSERDFVDIAICNNSGNFYFVIAMKNNSNGTITSLKSDKAITYSSWPTTGIIEFGTIPYCKKLFAYGASAYAIDDTISTIYRKAITTTASATWASHGSISSGFPKDITSVDAFIVVASSDGTIFSNSSVSSTTWTNRGKASTNEGLSGRNVASIIANGTDASTYINIITDNGIVFSELKSAADDFTSTSAWSYSGVGPFGKVRFAKSGEMTVACAAGVGIFAQWSGYLGWSKPGMWHLPMTTVYNSYLVSGQKYCYDTQYNMELGKFLFVEKDYGKTYYGSEYGSGYAEEKGTLTLLSSNETVIGLFGLEDKFVAVTSAGRVARLDPATDEGWSILYTPSSSMSLSICCIDSANDTMNNYIVAGNANSSQIYIFDIANYGNGWQNFGNLKYGPLTDIAGSEGVFVAICNSQGMTNAKNITDNYASQWVSYGGHGSSVGLTSPVSISVGNGKFMICGDQNAVYSKVIERASSAPTQWTSHAVPSPGEYGEYFSNITYIPAKPERQ